MLKPVIFLFVLIIFSSCVSTKDMTYFQGDPITTSKIKELNNEPYRVQINDILYINIKSDKPETVALFNASENSLGSSGSSSLYFTGYTVDRHGNIRIPYLGEINVLGFTENEIRNKIENDLSTFLKNPETVFVTVKLAGIRFVVTGEVGKPGTLFLSQNQVSIVDAISNAGEITDMGNRHKVTVIRKTIDGVKKYSLDLTSIDIFNSDNFYIQPNDVIYVAPIKQKAWGFGTTGLQSFSTVASILSFLASSVLLIKNL